MGDGKGFHEATHEMSAQTMDRHRALVSLQEELEAVDWYQQRADACKDGALREILLHNMREEVEHAVMVLEWLRRNHEAFAENMDTYLYSEGDITAVEESATGGDSAPSPDRGSRRATIGALGKKKP